MSASVVKHWGLSLSLSGLMFVAGCGSDGGTGGGAELLQPALESTVDNTIVPAMESFADEATSFEQEASEFCASPSESTLTALQDRWLELTRVWNQAATYLVGPLDDDPITPSINFIESMRPRGTDYTETVRDTIDSALQSTDPLDEAFFAGLTFNRVGILALEVLTFEDFPRTAGSTEITDVLEGYNTTPRKCTYLEGMAGLLAERARGVESGWTEDFNGSGTPFRDLLLDGELDDGSLPVPAVIVSAVAHLEYLRRRKLDGILDAQVATRARPDESPFFANLEAALAEIENLMEPSNGESGFFDVMTERGFAEFVATVRSNHSAALAAVQAEDRTAAVDAFRNLENSLRREVALGRGVDLGIDFTDGD